VENAAAVKAIAMHDTLLDVDATVRFIPPLFVAIEALGKLNVRITDGRSPARRSDRT
jgi:hypothetical protein